MKPKTKCILLLMLLVSANSFALDNHRIGARALSLSHAFVSFSDTWSTFHNQAGLAGMTGVSAGFFYESRFNIDELSLVAGSVVIPVKAGTFGAGFFQFGKGTFKEHKFGLAFAKKQNNSRTLLKTGIEFQPVENLALRFGVAGKPINYTAGIGYKTGKLSADIGFGYHGNLGITPSVSVQFEL